MSLSTFVRQACSILRIRWNYFANCVFSKDLSQEDLKNYSKTLSGPFELAVIYNDYDALKEILKTKTIDTSKSIDFQHYYIFNGSLYTSSGYNYRVLEAAMEKIYVYYDDNSYVQRDVKCIQLLLNYGFQFTDHDLYHIFGWGKDRIVEYLLHSCIHLDHIKRMFSLCRIACAYSTFKCVSFLIQHWTTILLSYCLHYKEKLFYFSY